MAEGVDLARIDRVARQALAVVCAIFLVCGIFSWLTDYLLPAQYAMVKYLVLCFIVQPLLYTLSEITRWELASLVERVCDMGHCGRRCANVLLSLWLVPDAWRSRCSGRQRRGLPCIFCRRTETSASVWRQFARARCMCLLVWRLLLAVATVSLGPTLPFHYALVWFAFTPVVGWCFRQSWQTAAGRSGEGAFSVQVCEPRHKRWGCASALPVSWKQP